MLDSIRKNAADSFMLKVLFGIIALVFVFFYVGTAGFSQLEVAATVNDELVTKRDFDRAYTNLDRFYRNNAPNNLPSANEIATQALEQVVNSELLLQEANDLGLKIGSQELRDSISSLPDFQIDGSFNKTRYLEVLSLNGMKPGDFEESHRRQLLTDKLADLVRAGVQVSDDELRERFEFENSRVSLRFIRIPVSDFTEGVTIDESELAEFYEESKEDFREPERSVIRYMAFRPTDFEKQVVPSEEDLQIYYDEQAEKYKVDEQVHARHILLKVPTGASDEEKKAIRDKAVEVRKLALDGADFAELAKQHSEDSTASNGGDLGAFARGAMTAPFEAAAFSTEPGTISDLVESVFGFHIIKVEEKLAARTRPLSEVRDEVTSGVQKRESRKLTLDKVEEAFEALQDGKAFDEIAETYGVAAKISDPFGRGEAIPGLGRLPEVNEAVLATEKDELGEIMNLNDGYIVFRVTDRITSRVPPLSEIRAKVEVAYRQNRASQAAASRAADLLAKLKSDADINALAEGEGVQAEDTGEIGRFGGYIPKLGNLPELKEAAFNLSESEPIAPNVYKLGFDAVIAVLDKHIPPPPERFETDKERLLTVMRAQKEAEATKLFLKGLRAKSRVEIGQGYDFAAQSNS